jgi:hypothetical protein
LLFSFVESGPPERPLHPQSEQHEDVAPIMIEDLMDVEVILIKERIKLVK